MKKLIPCMLAGFVFVGLFSLCITSFLSPSANYIQDTLVSPEEPFYITVNPENTTLFTGERSLLVARSNLDDVSYIWEVRLLGSDLWSMMPDSYIDGCFPIYSTSARTVYYRCAITHDNRTIYSAPCLVVISKPKSSSSDLKSFNDDFEINSDSEDFEVSEVID